MRSYLPIMLLLISSICLAQKTEEVPTTFGLITVTHTRAGDNSQFMKYLDKYATMDCPIMTEINIVWNNEQSMEELGIYEKKDAWVRPVYFYRTPNNSMNWRYKIPKESQSQVFFSIDDDITVDCQELNKGFQVWKENAIGSIAPIISYGPRYYEYTLKQGFQYGKGKVQNFFNMGLVGLAFISRHFMDLYYTDIFQVKEMRDYVVTKNNCDDIGLNWVVQYFYPELLTIPIEGNVLNISPKIAQATSQNHYPFRTKCIEKFTQIFGVNTLRYAPLKDDYPGHEKRTNPLKKEIVLAKKQYLEKYAIGKAESLASTSDFSSYFDKAIKEGTPPQVVTAPQPPKNEKPPTFLPPQMMDIKSPAVQEYKQKIVKLEGQIISLKEELLVSKKSLQNVGKEEKTISAVQVSKDQATPGELALIQQLRQTLYWRSYIEVGMGLSILILIWRAFYFDKSKIKGHKVIRLESNQVY